MPIEDAYVEVWQNGILIADGYTDATGRFTTSLLEGTYLIRISKAGYDTIEKTETIARSTELIVNLPTAAPGGVWDVIEDWDSVEFAADLDAPGVELVEAEDFSSALWSSIVVT